MRNTRRARLVLTILLLAAFSLITLDYRSNSLSGVRNVMSDIFGPVENGVTDVTHPIGSWFSSIGHLGSYKSQNNALKTKVAALENQLHLTGAERSELAQDQKILKLAGIAQFTVVGARVVAYGGGLGSDQTATINRGRSSGIKPNETVIAGNGLVGRTVVVGRSSATVLLADDPTFTVGARTESKKLEIGSVKGGGRNQPLTLQLLSTSAPLVVGEQLVTFAANATDRPFVPEVPIGFVTKVTSAAGGLTQTATVQPYVDLTAIDTVAVVVHAPPNGVKHDALLPAAPTPAPTVTVTVTTTPGTPTSGGSSSGSPGSTGSPGATTSSTP